MYIRKITLDNIKLFEHAEISFLDDSGSPRMWTVLVGENGLGKTTILQAIAMTALGETQSNKLVNVPSLVSRLKFADEANEEGRFGSMVSTFAIGENQIIPGISHSNGIPKSMVSVITSVQDVAVVFGDSRYYDSNIEIIKYRPAPLGNISQGKLHKRTFMGFGDPISDIRAQNLPGWFVVGYGVDRRLPSPHSAPELTDPAYQRVASLFDKGPIIATGFADLFDTKGKIREFSKALKSALLNNTKILPNISGLELRGKGGAASSKRLIEGDRFSFGLGKSAVKIPATWLSQGYQATIAWIADLIGQMFWDAGKPVALDEMEGLVLIDEIDIHLHPAWQVNLIEALKTTFPRLQFVVTTHSPMILPGLKREEILRIRRNEKGVVVVEPVDESPAVMTGSELYEAFFGVNGPFAKEVGDQLQKYGYLSSNPYRTDDEDREMIHLQQVLRQKDVLPEWEPVARDTSA